MEVGFRDLSPFLKVCVVGGLLYAIVFVVGFFYGFFIGLAGGV